MKIGLVCPYNMARGGAVQEIVKDMRDGLEQRGHEVRIITGQPKDLGELDTRGMIFIGSATDFRSPTHTTPTFSVSNDLEVIRQILESEKFDIIHFHEPWVPMLSRQLLSRSTSVNIATFHAQLPETVVSRTVAKTFTPYLKAILKDLDMLVSTGPAASEYVSSLTERPIHIVPIGIDLKRFSRPPRPRMNSPRRILYVGRLEHRKGVEYLVEAYRLLVQQEDDVELIIAGKGPLQQKLELMVQEYELPNVSFLGYVEDAHKMKLFAEADLFCSPAIFGEGFGLVLLEAMASSVVTVAGDNAGYSGVMKDLGALSLVNPKDTREFARRLKLLLNEAEVRDLWQKWAKKYVQQFDYPKIIDQYERLYVEALKQHAKKPAAR